MLTTMTLKRRSSRPLPTGEIFNGLPPYAPVRYVFNMPPLPKGRPRGQVIVGKRGKKPFVLMHTDERTRQYENLVREAAALQHPWHEPFEGPLDVFINLWVSSAVHGDIDNLGKAILDGMQGVAFKNDRQIKGEFLRLRLRRKKPPGIEVILMRSRWYEEEDEAGCPDDLCLECEFGICLIHKQEES